MADPQKSDVDEHKQEATVQVVQIHDDDSQIESQCGDDGWGLVMDEVFRGQKIVKIFKCNRCPNMWCSHGEHGIGMVSNVVRVPQIS